MKEKLHCPNCGHLVNVNIQGNLIPIHITKLNDSTHARIKKFNQLIEPQLLELNDWELELARLFLLGYLKKYVSVEEIGEISDALGTFIERDLS